MRTGKQMWEHLAEFSAAQEHAIESAADDELRHALGFGINQGDDHASSRLRAQIRRAIRRRGIDVPFELEELT